MPTPVDVWLGLLLQTIADGAQWDGEDDFPAYQGYADATKHVLGFALA